MERKSATKTDFKRRLLLGASAVVAMSFSVIPEAQAQNRVGEGVKHFFDCLGLMLTDPDMHQESCAPNNVKLPFGSIASSGDRAGVAAAPVVVVGGGGEGGGGDTDL